MFKPPPLGVGMMYFPALAAFYKSCGGLIDVLEIEPQTLWLNTRDQSKIEQKIAPKIEPKIELDRLAFAQLLSYPQAKLVHGVGMPLAATVPPDPRQFAPWCASVKCTQTPWASEHLAFQRLPTTGGADQHSGFLLPPLQCTDTVEMAAQRIAALRQLSGVPIAFENSPNYLRAGKGEIADGEFYARVAERADCGIVLDLHNLWCNERNGRQSMREVLEALPLDRIWEVHLAGGEARNGFWLDAHSGWLPEPVLAFCHEWLPRMANLGAIIFEIMPEYVQAKGVQPTDLQVELQKMQALWQSCQRSKAAQVVNPFVCPGKPMGESEHCMSAQFPKNSAPALWENCLGYLVNSRSLPEGDETSLLTKDPGVAILQELVHSQRAGTLADGLTLSWRFLTLRIGEAATEKLMAEFWLSQWPQAFASDELALFGEFVREKLASGALDVRYLRNVLDYELGRLHALTNAADHDEVAVNRAEQWVNFDCEPLELLNALARGVLPEKITPGCYALKVV